MLLVRLGMEMGDRVHPTEVVAATPVTSDVRSAFATAKAEGWLDEDGYVTEKGRDAAERWMRRRMR